MGADKIIRNILFEGKLHSPGVTVKTMGQAIAS